MPLSIFLSLPDAIGFDVFNKMDFKSLSRLRRTCKAIDTLVGNERNRLARKISEFELFVTVFNSKIDYEISNTFNESKVEVKVSNSLESLSGLGFRSVYLETRKNYKTFFDINLYKEVNDLLAAMKIVAKSFHVIDFPDENSLEIVSIPERFQNLHLHYFNYSPNQKEVFIQVLSDKRVKVKKRLSLEIGGLYNHLPENVMRYVIHNEVLTLQLLNKGNVSKILSEMQNAKDFGNLQLLTCFVHLQNYDESDIVFPYSNQIYTNNSGMLPYGFAATSVSVLDTSSKHVLVSEGFYMNPIQKNMHFRYYSMLLLDKTKSDEVFGIGSD